MREEKTIELEKRKAMQTVLCPAGIIGNILLKGCILETLIFVPAYFTRCKPDFPSRPTEKSKRIIDYISLTSLVRIKTFY